ncbi:MAG TPA: carboxypeptidase regulatory-like domain-containing protein [Kofleriaceae bacterium]|nr:carboxypeptidase regulatory-like domain-containing protein [Kofleriaceae bacterium]
MMRVGLVLALVAAAAAPVRAQPTGSVKGTVIFEGEPPERQKLRRETDPLCAKIERLSEDVVVTNGKLKDVLVRVKNGALLPAAKAAPAPVVIDQKDCMYAPRVVGVVAGQKIAVRNSDPAFHNVHGAIAGKLLWNKPASPKDPDLVLETSTQPGDVIDVTCDVHPWMHAYAVVQAHAAFAVTDERGAFEIRGLPPGSYTLEAWHPVLGTRTLDVKIGGGAKAAVTARISYKRSEMP